MATAASRPSPDLIARAQRGDADARNQLVREMMPFIRHIAKGRTGRMPTEDMIQDGVVGLLEALKRFKPGEHAASFQTFAFYRILGRIRDGLASEYDFLSRWESDRIDNIEQRESAAPSDQLSLNFLPERQRRIVESHFGLNGQRERALKEIADGLGLTRSRVHQILQSALARLSTRLDND